ncbi:MAG: hypothetical protein HPM95_06865 [Alphaproteobacteria bacterium]|nr:hypothetical protein [Alphaproteobacteria bacterium]
MVADRVALCLPAPQVAALTQDFSQAAAALASVDIAPCWAVMIAFEDPPLPGTLPDAGPQAGGPIAWMATEGTKPARDAGPARLVLHASPGGAAPIWNARPRTPPACCWTP